MLLHLHQRSTRSGSCRFSQGELSLILGVYAEQVQRGVWRDYAIDSLPEMALFSIYRSSKEAPIYRVSKFRSPKKGGAATFALFSGDKAVVSGVSLKEVIAHLNAETA